MASNFPTLLRSLRTTFIVSFFFVPASVLLAYPLLFLENVFFFVTAAVASGLAFAALSFLVVTLIAVARLAWLGLGKSLHRLVALAR